MEWKGAVMLVDFEHCMDRIISWAIFNFLFFFLIFSAFIQSIIHILVTSHLYNNCFLCPTLTLIMGRWGRACPSAIILNRSPSQASAGNRGVLETIYYSYFFFGP